MEQLHKKRFIAIATPTLKADSDPDAGFAKFLRKVLVPLTMPHAFREITKLGEVIKASQLDWSVVRFLNPNTKTDGNGYRLAVGTEKYKMAVSRRNIAASMYAVAKENTYLKEMPVVFNI